MNSEWDSVVIGGGAAGLSAGLVLGRARRRALVVDRGGQSNLPSAHIGGLLAQEGTAPAELYDRGREQLAGYETVSVRDAEVTDARPDGDGFAVALSGEDAEVRTRTLILATGMDYEMPDIPGFREHWGNAVFHCPFCHGWEVRDRRVVICGAGETAEHQATLLRGWTEDVTVVDPETIARARSEDGALKAVVRQDGSEVECDAVMVHAPLRRRGELPERLGLALTDSGFVEVDDLGKTSVPGVYAAGDVAVAPQQVVIAMASGHLAAVAVVRELTLGRG
ncbi:MAG TPA: NAD(P)/FAD-dependent oxidoreductase [Solirubrobacterales bacterium]|nr:NAD(P)/FAD-dependent oxidoreductase [Solirubrobacterales bacterium]